LPAPVKKWREIRASGSAVGKDKAIALLVSAGSGAVIESAMSAESSLELKREQTLTACLPEGADEALFSLNAGLKALGWAMTLSTIEDRDWSVAWRAGMRPLRVSSRGQGRGGMGLLVHTSWSKARKRPYEAEVIIDPSMAFGTGAHPTTKMCLKALVKLLGVPSLPAAKGRILDVGTGSAILMIAALKLGMRGAAGLEIDTLAIKVARKNLKLNHVRASITQKPISHVRGKFSIITANIFSEELRRLAPDIVDKLCNNSGYIVLSGILREQAPPLVSIYKRLGMRVFKSFVDGEWACLVLRRSTDKG